MLFGMGDPAAESAVFEGFLNNAPVFAGAVVERWSLSSEEPADITCYLVDGRRIGVQLTTWLDEQRMKEAKDHERLELSLQQALEPTPPNKTEHISSVWIYAKGQPRDSDAQEFRKEMLRLVDDLDEQWDSMPEWQSPQGFQWDDFTRYPVLRKYLGALEVRSRVPSIDSTMRKGTTGWLIPEPRGGYYDPDDMVDALCDRMLAKVARYQTKSPRVGELYLLVHYDKAWVYNPPVTGVQFGYADAVQAAARLGASIGASDKIFKAFDKIFVYVPFGDDERVYELSRLIQESQGDYVTPGKR